MNCQRTVVLPKKQIASCKCNFTDFEFVDIHKRVILELEFGTCICVCLQAVKIVCLVYAGAV